METRKLYYEDSMLWEFSAQVLECTETDKGFAVVLDATAFYPEGGGQACDLGTLADTNVLGNADGDAVGNIFANGCGILACGDSLINGGLLIHQGQIQTTMRNSEASRAS